MLVATCRLCRQIIKATVVKQSAGKGGPATEISDQDRQCMAFSEAFGQHIQMHHAVEFQCLEALLVQCSGAGMQVVGFVALRNAESADPVFQAWRAAEAKQILKALEELRQMVQPV